MANFIGFFWAIRTIKFVLFWVYLWQLKNYHVGRFVDHFRTHQGKKIFFNTLYLVKLFLLFLLFINPVFLYIVLFTYVAENSIFFLQIYKKNVRLPKFTLKAILLTTILCAGVLVFGVGTYYYLLSVKAVFYLLVFDILLPVFVSVIVLLAQPFFVMARTRILKKAKEKMKKFPRLKVIGITGSYGKTSTKEFLTTILSSKFNVLSTPDHKNSEIGIAQTILQNLTGKHEIFIVEMGAYNKGGIDLLCDMVRPNIGLVTGVNQQHLATFGSLENLLSAEGGRELANRLSQHGVMILNGDNAHCLDLYKNIMGKKTGGTGKSALLYAVKKDKLESDIWNEDLEIKKHSISFIVAVREIWLGQVISRKAEMAHFNVNVVGGHNIQNMLGAILAAKELGMSLEQISLACKNIKPEQAGITLKKAKYGISIIDSSYSSNPDGVTADLDYLHIFEGRRVVVMPCLIELGKKSKEVHYQIGKKIAEICDLAIITTRDQFEQIKKGAMENGMSEEGIILCDSPSEIWGHVTTFCKAGDAVLLEGRVPGELIRLFEK